MQTPLGLKLCSMMVGYMRVRRLNAVWANNGDTLSLCYAHTSALKGDFVRTGKRDFSGMVSSDHE